MGVLGKRTAKRIEREDGRRCVGCKMNPLEADGGKLPRGLCMTCYRRCAREGTLPPSIPGKGSGPLPDGTKRVFRGGYVRIKKDGDWVSEHRAVMMDALGRELLPHENVHHINGDRGDNRPSNLELWNTYQPAGQRIPDKLAWAREIIELYG